MALNQLSIEAQSAIDILRALIVSKKNSPNLQELLKDYREMNGATLEFRKFGFQSAEEFLRSSEEFNFVNRQGQLVVMAHPTKNSSHITAMVSRQKIPKRRGAALRAPRNSDQSWNKSSYFSSNVYRQMPTTRSRPNYKKNSRYAILCNNNNQSRNNGPPPPTKIYVGDTNNNIPISNNRNVTIIHTQQQQNIQKPELKVEIKSDNNTSDLRNRLNAKNNIAENSSKYSTKQEVQPRPISGQNSLPLTENKIKKPSSIAVSVPPKKVTDVKDKNLKLELKSEDKLQNGNEKQSDSKNYDENKKIPTAINMQITNNRSSVQNRLLMIQNINNIPETTKKTPIVLEQTNKPNDSKYVGSVPLKLSPSTSKTDSSSSNQQTNLPQKILSNNSTQETVTVINNNSTQSEDQKVISDRNFQFNPNTKPMIALFEYCSVRRLSVPEYHVLKMGYTGTLFISRVTVDNVTYSTYPHDYDTVEKAKEAAAKIAIDNINSIENKKQAPVCMDSDCELVLKIHDEIEANYPGGVFVKSFPEIFEKIFKESLPDHWLSIVENSRYFNVQSAIGGHSIININREYSSSSLSTDQPSDSETEYPLLNHYIDLPWYDKYWNLYITHCVSTTEVWARIVDKKYSEQLDSLQNDIDMEMLTEKKRPVSITTGQMYLVCVAECWHRVRLEKIDKGSGKCLCVFVDFGDDDWVAMDQLHVCEEKFLSLPAQAIPFSLYGLEDFAENPVAKRNIDTTLMGKSLVAEILTKRDVYEQKSIDNNEDLINKIEIVLYDTSSDEDINLNPLLLNNICNETAPPELKRDGVTNVIITHINTDGEIYVQVRTLGLAYVEKLIYQLVQSKFKENQHMVTLDELKQSNLFLVKDNNCDRWVRGCLADNTYRINDETVNIFYVDHGNVKKIHISQIYRLDSLSTALNQFPRQAIKTTLYNIPPVNNTILARIKGLMRVNYPAIVKLAFLSVDICKNVVPEIIAYVRFERNDSLCNVNEAIRIEYELERNMEFETDGTNKSYDTNLKSAPTSPLPPPSPTSNHPSNIMSEMTACIRNVSIRSPNSVRRYATNEPMQQISENQWLPEVGEIFNVLVILSSNPYNFMVQSYNDYPAYQEMMLNLQNFCKTIAKDTPLPTITVNEAYAAKKSDGNYYRVIVEQVLPTDMCYVSFCDCGDVTVVKTKVLKPLPNEFRKMPKQALHAKLHGVKPVKKEWTSNDSIRFRELTLGLKFASLVQNITIDTFLKTKPKVLELSLIDVSTDDDVYIHTILVEENRAIEV